MILKELNVSEFFKSSKTTYFIHLDTQVFLFLSKQFTKTIQAEQSDKKLYKKTTNIITFTPVYHLSTRAQLKAYQSFTRLWKLWKNTCKGQSPG